MYDHIYTHIYHIYDHQPISMFKHIYGCESHVNDQFVVYLLARLHYPWPGVAFLQGCAEVASASPQTTARRDAHPVGVNQQQRHGPAQRSLEPKIFEVHGLGWDMLEYCKAFFPIDDLFVAMFHPKILGQSNPFVF